MSIKSRVEKLEQSNGSKEEVIIVIDTIDQPELLNPEIMEKKQADYEKKYTKEDIVFIIIEEKDMSKGQVDFDDNDYLSCQG